MEQIHIGKEELKLSISADNMILYIEYPRNSTKNYLELIMGFSNVATYRINTQESLAFVYPTINEMRRKL